MNTRIINKYGTMQGWNSITTNWMGRDIEGIAEIAYDDTIEKENVPGAGGYPVGRARKNYGATCKVVLYKEEVDAMRQALPPGKRLQDIAPSDIVVEYANDEGVINKDIICNVEFTKVGVATKQGDGTVTQECELIVSHIEWNVI